MEQQATRAWATLALVIGASVVAILWRVLVVPVLVGDVLMCAASLVLTSTGLRALREQARVQEQESLHDPVTELPNRILFHQQVQRRIAESASGAGLSVVMLLDLDRFKEVNDAFGHHQGDLLLHEVGRRIRDAVRPDDLVARLGGDEFAVFASGLESSEDGRALAGQLGRSIAQGAELAGVSLELETSIGLSLHPEHGHDVEELLAHADVAMYRAKQQHTAVETYCVESDPSSRVRLGLLADLRAAIADGQLLMHYQPKVASRTGGAVGLEGLVRWAHPEHGLIYPDQFIPLAENTSLMRPLTSHVLDLALAQCRAWRDAGHGELAVAVNLATRNLLDSGLPDEVSERLAHHGLPPSALELEVTETTLMVDPVRAKAVLTALSQLGVGLAIDDFGTGYTSLSWLGELPFTTLKIDKSFVMRMTADAKALAIVRGSVALGRNLGLRVVAEGIESAEVWQALAALECEDLQGYYFSRPLPAEAVQPWLAARALANAA